MLQNHGHNLDLFLIRSSISVNIILHCYVSINTRIVVWFAIDIYVDDIPNHHQQCHNPIGFANMELYSPKGRKGMNYLFMNEATS